MVPSCVRERRRRWRTWRRTWRCDADEEAAAGETWDEMLFGGGGAISGFNWNEATAEQVWEEMFYAGGQLVLSLNGATFEQIWNGLVWGGDDLFFGWDELFL